MAGLLAPHSPRQSASARRARWTSVIGVAVTLATVAAGTAGASGTAYRATPTSTGTCPSATSTVPNKDDFVTNASNTTFHAGGDAWNQKAGVDDSTREFNASGGSGDCYVGGKIQGTH